MSARSAGFATFGTLRTDGTATASALVARISAGISDDQRHFPGFLSSTVLLSLDGTTVVTHGLWVDEPSYRASTTPTENGGVACSASGERGIVHSELFLGVPTEGITGPAADEEPGYVTVATRHVNGPEAGRALAGLLVRSGDWKRDFPGFVAATPYLGLDGTTYVNYPRWVDDQAFERYMADPRNARGRQDLERWETAPPEFVHCRVAARFTAPTAAREART